MRSHPTRTRARNRLYLIGILPALLMLLVSGRITLLLVEESSGLSAFDAEEYVAARDDFAANQVLNPFEPWLAHFDEGTARHQDEDLRGAVAAYEEAMDEGVPPEWDCRVRNNLALAHEQLGDAALEARGRVAAEDEWLIAREVLAECLEKLSDTEEERDPLDTDGDGTVSAEEADTDDDGTLSPGEYAAAASDDAVSAEVADTDGDGTVSPEEYAAAAAVAEAMSAEEVDADGDGTVSPEEYAAAVAAAQAAGPEDPDADNDGTVSAEENSKVIDKRVAEKLRDREPDEPPTATDPPPANESVAERERQLSERDRRALEQRRRQEQRREEREASEPDPDPGDVRIPHW